MSIIRMVTCNLLSTYYFECLKSTFFIFYSIIIVILQMRKPKLKEIIICPIPNS